MTIVFRKILFGIAALFLSLLNAYASAEPVSDARAALIAGQYDTALSVLQGRSDAPSLTLKAEILSAQVMLGLPDNLHKAAIAAREAAEQAVMLSPSSDEAIIQRALALGFEARTASIFKAWRKKLPQRCYDAIDAAQRAAPQDARPKALMGAWHLGLVRKAGNNRAMSMFGASELAGMKWYEQALETSPDNIVILSNYAFTLLSLDHARHHDVIQTLAERALNTVAKDATDREVQKRLRSLMSVIDDPQALANQIDLLMNDAG